MKLSELFISIQGEGIYNGCPSVFIRTTGCVLSCPYCDTKYALKNGGTFNVNKIIDYIERSNIRKIVITGGEPLMHYQSVAMKELVIRLLNAKYKITFETTFMMTKSDIGGSTFKNNYMKLVDAWGADVVDNCYFSVSPKLTPKSYHCPNVTLNNIIDFYNYGGKDDPFIRTVVLSNVFFKFIYHKKYEKSILKFVMSFNDKLMMIFNSYMMPFTPQPLNTKEYNEICKDAVKFCVDHDYRYSPRIHVDIWGLDKGV